MSLKKVNKVLDIEVSSFSSFLFTKKKKKKTIEKLS
jgi:hypothetical protein